MAGTLYLVPTPIGNLSDISPRCRQTLAEADFIAAEDTRVTMNLLNHFEIRKPLVSYYEHNKRQRGGEILSRLQAGESAVLVTDAGMPAISDPGEELVALCHDVNIKVCLEGVEREEEFDRVRSMGLDFIQGFLFGKPVPPDVFERDFLMP